MYDHQVFWSLLLLYIGGLKPIFGIKLCDPAESELLAHEKRAA